MAWLIVNKNKSVRKIFWGIALILCAVILILDAVGVAPLRDTGITIWRAIVGLLLVAWVISEFIQKKPIDAIIPLAILFLVFEAPIAHALGRADANLISNWIVIVAAILLSIGLNLIFRGNGKD